MIEVCVVDAAAYHRSSSYQCEALLCAYLQQEAVNAIPLTSITHK